MRRAVVVCGVFFLAAACQAGIIYVDVSAPGANNGTSWLDAYHFLQDALTAAVSGDTIQVAQGTYHPDANTAYPNGTGDRAATFTLKTGVTAKSGYAGYGQADPNARDISAYETILSGDLNEDDGPDFANNGENSYHVVTTNGTGQDTILDGFTITGGNANLSNYYGGGIYNSSGSPTINNCCIKQNYSNGRGAFYNSNGNPTLTDCIFSTNRSKYNAGAIQNSGGNFVLNKCKFLGNETQNGFGGAAYNTGILTAVDCLFAGNTAANRTGGGIYTVSDVTLTNCVFTGNSATNGGGIYNSGGTLTLTNCTFSANSAYGVYTRDNTTTVTNCIFWDNGGSQEYHQIYFYNCTRVINYSCVQGWTGSYGGTGNIGGNPHFADANGPDDIFGTEDDDLTIPLGVSACIDAGDNSAVPSGVVSDIGGNPRFYNDPEIDDTGQGDPPVVDMGAYEAYPGDQPEIGLTLDHLEFTTIEGYTNPDSQFLYVRNRGGGTVNWQASEDSTWMEVWPISGSSTGEMDAIEVSVDISSLSAGHYEGDITVSDGNAINSPQIAGVVLDVSPPWKTQIAFPNEPFCANGVFVNDPRWVKFTIKLDDPCTVYFQDSEEYLFHYDWATIWLEPFIGMSRNEYNLITLYEQGQEAALGAVIMPADPDIKEYGIQLIRYDPYTKEETADMFNTVKASIVAEPNVQVFYFPSYEQLADAEANSAWLEAQGIPISSTVRWASGNACYSSGWALGTLKYFDGNEIQAAYTAGELLPEDILLTDGVPAEVPFVAGILSLLPSTPSSHVAILAQTFGIPFGHLALAEDANLAQQLVGRMVLVSVGEQDGVGVIGIKDMTGLLTQEEIDQILTLKAPEALEITAMEAYGSYSTSTNGLEPNNIRYFGGKAANYGILRRAIPSNCPNAAAFSFELWNEFLDQPLTPSENVIVAPNRYVVFWADDQPGQGPTHAEFKLSRSGEDIGLFDIDGTLIDGFSFGGQTTDVSYGRTPDGNDSWSFFYGGDISPNAPNPGGAGVTGAGLFINEFMADNDTIVADEYGEYDDWIEIYNSGSTTVDLGGMYLTDDPKDPTKWMISVGISGSTLREEIANRLSGYTYPPSDLGALSADLAAIRNIITNPNITSFSPQMEDAIIAILQDPNNNFDPNSNIRFRSSTNVEDANRFSGAGLYDSYSGCLADDLDGDESGPCICDPNESNERGVFRAIQKVFASFYNENAFLERLRHSVDENDVGMGMLVHHSFPDEFELANGVATLERREDDPNRYIKLVTQKGAVSVANPEDGSIPEEVSVLYKSESEVEITLARSSNLVILGEMVMEWQNDYNDLTGLLIAASEKFEQVTNKTAYILDFEYKKVAAGGAAIPAGGLVVKQIREIPEYGESMNVNTAFLVNEPMTYVTFQGEGNSVYSKHCLKNRLTLSTKNMWMTPENMAKSFYGVVSIEYAADGRIRTITGQLPLLPSQSHTFTGTTATDGWIMHHLCNPRAYTLTTQNVKTQVGPAESPIVTLSDFGQPMQGYISRLKIGADYARPLWSGGPSGGEIRIVSLELTDYLFQERSFTDSGITITTTFYYAYWESMILTYPVSSFVETTITGLTTQPIVLHGYYSQTYHPNHHNFGEHFLFEPRLEPGISQSIIDQLEAQNIQLIYFYNDYYGPSISTLSYEDIPFLVSDIDDDGDVDLSDFARLGSRWFDVGCDECGSADLTGDGRVDIDDLYEFTQEWLEEL